MPAYYNEIDGYAAQWLRNLIAAGLIAPGDVDERSIVDVRPADLRGYHQCHFFAGVGGWSAALRLAGWPDDRPVWTGSCPCQPFSAAGRGEGIDDARHLWPAFFRLIRECRPSVAIGEQVASKDGLAWLDHVCLDLEAEGYAVGAVDTCAASVGAPHIRQRLYWVADAGHFQRPAWSARSQHQPTAPKRELSGSDGASSGMADDIGNRLEGGAEQAVLGERRRDEGNALGRGGASLAVNGYWGGAEWIACRDGKARPTVAAAELLAHGFAADLGVLCSAEAFQGSRAGMLKGFGNAIVVPQAAEFIGAVMDVIGESGCAQKRLTAGSAK